MDAQELCLQERENIVSRRNKELENADMELTKLCQELEENKEKVRAQGGQGDKLAKLNW